MRSLQISRLYLQCEPYEDLSQWPDDRIWKELQTRLRDGSGWTLKEGPMTKGVTGMRSSAERTDAIRKDVPGGRRRPHSASDRRKGHESCDFRRNSVSFTRAFAAYYRDDSQGLLREYSATCLRRIWKAQRFSAWMTAASPNPGPVGHLILAGNLRNSITSRVLRQRQPYWLRTMLAYLCKLIIIDET